MDLMTGTCKFALAGEKGVKSQSATLQSKFLLQTNFCNQTMQSNFLLQYLCFCPKRIQCPYKAKECLGASNSRGVWRGVWWECLRCSLPGLCPGLHSIGQYCIPGKIQPKLSWRQGFLYTLLSQPSSAPVLEKSECVSVLHLLWLWLLLWIGLF